METMNTVQSRSNSNYNFYTPNGWAGKNYDHNLKGKDIAAKVRAFVKNEFPDFKFSIRSKFGMQADTIYITVLSGPIPALCEGNTRSYESSISGFGDAFKGRITDNMLAVLDKVYSFVSSFRYSDCDGMIDYFDTNFYCRMYVGDYDRPYQITEKKERKQNNAPANSPSKSEEVKPVETVSGFEIVEYSEKSIAVFGDTKSIKEELKALGGKFNPVLKNNGEKRAGWIFPKKQADKVRALLAPAACVCSETSQNLNTKEEEVKPVVEHYFVKKKTDLEQLIESGDLDSINEMIKQKEEALNNAIENVNYYKEINNIEFMENEEVRAGRLRRDLELLKTAIKEASNTKNMDSPAYGDSETSQLRTSDSGMVRGQKLYAVGGYGSKQVYAVLDPVTRTCVEVGNPDDIKDWEIERYFRPLQRFRPNIQPASNRNGIGFYYAENEPIYSEMDLKRFCERADKIEAMKKNLEEEKRIQSEKNKADLLDKYPYLKRPEYPFDYKSIMYNLRSVLKHEFPDTSFSVRRDSRDNAIIRWEDGPDEKDVLRVASLFEGKTFHAETDYEDFIYTDFISLFGSLGYIFTERTETEIIQLKTEIIQPETETIQPETETIRQETEIKENRFYTDIREDYAPFPYVVVDRLDGSVWFFTDSEDEAKEWAADYNQEYSDGGKRKKQPDVEHEVIRTDLAKCAG